MMLGCCMNQQQRAFKTGSAFEERRRCVSLRSWKAQVSLGVMGVIIQPIGHGSTRNRRLEHARLPQDRKRRHISTKGPSGDSDSVQVELGIDHSEGTETGGVACQRNASYLQLTRASPSTPSPPCPD